MLWLNTVWAILLISTHLWPLIMAATWFIVVCERDSPAGYFFFIVWEKNSHSSRSSSSSRSSLVFFVLGLHIMHYREWILLPQCTLTPSTHHVDDSISYWTHGDNRTITLWQRLPNPSKWIREEEKKKNTISWTEKSKLVSLYHFKPPQWFSSVALQLSFSFTNAGSLRQTAVYLRLCSLSLISSMLFMSPVST